MSRFFLSYAHSAPLTTSGRRDTDTDVWVRRCFEDLSRAVADRTGAEPADVGFADYLLEPGTDWKALITEQLARAAVFVPLYSPGYFNKSWPMRERAVFQDRLGRAFPGQPDRARAHIIEVLWIPLPAGDRMAEVSAALPLGAGIEEYAENGLRALGMLASYRHHYRRIIEKLAQQIVQVGAHSQLPPSRAVPIDEIAVPDTPSPDTPFVVAVLGGRGTPWKPYGGVLDPPVAEFAATVAERLGLPTRTVDQSGDLKSLDDSPAVVLVEPRREDRLGPLRGHLHRWVTPIVVTGAQDSGYNEVTASRLEALGAARVYQVSDVGQLADLMPSAVSEARRHYLRRAAVHSRDAAARPTLHGSVIPANGKTERSSSDD
ncbi:TIR-like protein FxsC [Actinoplanes missouriensis]|uniref:TIR-like protein FxsC n=1 Tax=Actinoplanes missouriensis TaxID=1866 RepID=UPI0033CCA6B6